MIPVESEVAPAMPDARPASDARARAADFFELAKPRIAVLSVATALAGFYMASPGPMDLPLLGHALGGAALVGGGASGLNQALERDYDALMARTANRPLPSGRLSLVEATLFSLALSVVGVAWLALAVNALSAVVAFATLVVYVVLYTPLKRVSVQNTLVGAVAGALPPMIGWAAAAGELPTPAWTLFAILYFWQIPHVFAIAWLHREDYLRGGFVMIAGDDPEGRLLPLRILGQSLLMVVASFTPVLWNVAGRPYFFAALALGVAFLGFGVAFARSRSKTDARRVMFASIAYLPLLLIALALDKS